MACRKKSISQTGDLSEKRGLEELLESKFSERYESLKTLMEVQLEELYDSVERAMEKVSLSLLFSWQILQDELIQIMRQDSISSQFIQQRVFEILEGVLRSDRERLVQKLSEQCSILRAECQFLQNKSELVASIRFMRYKQYRTRKRNAARGRKLQSWLRNFRQRSLRMSSCNAEGGINC